ncbi:hypothetical protein ACOI1H_21455 [Loktanella sp. DJP18]|uniref:hypothetical protein n=1 Tax=Loktanella sp. DJP18 TaxID=3409788 RepID=UPI003BB5DC9A
MFFGLFIFAFVIVPGLFAIMPSSRRPMRGARSSYMSRRALYRRRSSRKPSRRRY